MRLHRLVPLFLVLAGACAAPLFGAEQTFVLRNYDAVRGERYMGAVDFGTFRPKSGAPQSRWVGYGAAPIFTAEYHGEQRLATEFDLGCIPRGAVTRAMLRYTLVFQKDAGPAFVELYQVAHFPDKVGALVGRKDVAAQKAGGEVALEFDVADAVRAAESHAAFELAGPYDREICCVYCGGRQGPVVRHPERLPLTPAQRPTLTLAVEAPADLPPPLTGACAGVGAETRFGPAADMAYRLVEKPPESALTNRDVAGGTVRPDVEGRFVVEGTKAGVKQYAAIEARRVLPHHPRLWLTPQKLEMLRAIRAEGHPVWLDLLRSTDSLCRPGAPLPEAGYAGFGYLGAIESLSLRYAVTRDKSFADKCKEVMDHITETSVAFASQDHGFNIRACGRALALGFDRIYPELTAEEKWKYVDEMNFWLAWYAEEGYQSNGPPCGNYFSGYFAALNMAAYTTYQDNPRGYILVDRMRELFDRFIVQEAAHGVLRGGDDPEGRYADLYFDCWFRYLIARSTAGSEAPVPGFVWPQEVARAQIHRLRPDRRTVYDCGDWRDNLPSWPSASTMALLSGLLAGRKEGEYAERFANQQYALTKKSLTLENYVTFDPDRPEKEWDSEPMSYFSRGLGLATMRSSWGKDAVWASFQDAGPHFADHQHYDAGHWEIYRGADPLVIDPDSDAPEGALTVVHNCLVIDSGPEVNPDSSRQSGAAGVSQAYEDAGAYVYLAGDFAAHYTFRDKSHVKALQRQFLYIRPNIFVLFDRFQPADERYKAVNRIHFARPPQVDGSTIVAGSGTSMVWARAFGAMPVVITRPGGQYQENAVDIAVPSGSGPKLMIVVLAALPGGEAPPEASCEVQGADVRVHFRGATAAEVTLHSDGTPGGAVTFEGKTYPLAAEIRAPALDR